VKEFLVGLGWIIFLPLAFLAGLVVIFIGGNWIEYTVRTWLTKKPTPEEIAQWAKDYDEQLTNPEVEAVEEFLKGKLPTSIVELYRDKESVCQSSFEIVGPEGTNTDNTWFINCFTPCNIKSQENFLPKDAGSFFEFANDGCGDSYYVQLTAERLDDAPVYFFDHEGGELFDNRVAPSARSFLSWKRRPTR
jgi:hypothetical protein